MEASSYRRLERERRRSIIKVVEFFSLPIILPIILAFISLLPVFSALQLFLVPIMAVPLVYLISIPVRYKQARREAERDSLDSDDADERFEARRRIRARVQREKEDGTRAEEMKSAAFSLARLLPVVIFVTAALLLCYSGKTMYIGAWFIGNETLGFYSANLLTRILLFLGGTLAYWWVLVVASGSLLSEPTRQSKRRHPGVREKVRSFFAKPGVGMVISVAAAIFAAIALAAITGISAINRFGF